MRALLALCDVCPGQVIAPPTGTRRMTTMAQHRQLALRIGGLASPAVSFERSAVEQVSRSSNAPMSRTALWGFAGVTAMPSTARDMLQVSQDLARKALSLR